MWSCRQIFSEHYQNSCGLLGPCAMVAAGGHRNFSSLGSMNILETAHADTAEQLQESTLEGYCGIVY